MHIYVYTRYTSVFMPFKRAPQTAQDFCTTPELGPYAPAPKVTGAPEAASPLTHARTLNSILDTRTS